MKRILLVLTELSLLLMAGLVYATPNLRLPYPAGESRAVTRAYQGGPGESANTTHKNYGLWADDRFALDFALGGCEIYGTPVLAVADGYVEVASNTDGGGYGINLLINHGSGYKSRYAHLFEISVEDGSYVEQGDELGKVGNTGSVFGTACEAHPGAHLHFALYQDGIGIKPEPMSGYTDFVSGRTYVSDNVSRYGVDLLNRSILAKCSFGFIPSNGDQLHPSAVIVLGDSGWHPFKREQALEAYYARTWRSEDEIQHLTQSQMASKNSKVAWELDIDDFIKPGVAVKYLPGYLVVNSQGELEYFEPSTVFFFGSDKKWHPLQDLETMQAFGIADGDLFYPDKMVLDYYLTGELYTPDDGMSIVVPDLPDGIGGRYGASPESPANLRIINEP